MQTADIIIIIDAFYYNKAVGKVHSLDAAFAQQYIVLIFVLKIHMQTDVFRVERYK